MKPRWSLLGDWNCTWDLSYNVPTEDILRERKSDSMFRFEIKVAHLLHTIPSDKYELKVAFPEGANIVSHNFEGVAKPSKIAMDTSFSYLDFLGRPTLVLTFNDYLPRMDQNAKIVVEYTLQDHKIFIEPLYLICGLMLCFTIYLAFSKLDLSFGSEELEELLELEEEKNAKKALTDQPKQSQPKKK